MQFTELTDKQWEMIQKHLPKPADTGRPRIMIVQQSMESFTF